jgi:hypothetical protein
MQPVGGSYSVEKEEFAAEPILPKKKRKKQEPSVFFY